MSSALDRWHQWAAADAEARGIPGLAPLIDGLTASIARLRSIDWQAQTESTTPQNPAPPPESGRQ